MESLQPKPEKLLSVVAVRLASASSAPVSFKCICISQLDDVAITQHCCHGPVQLQQALEHVVDAIPSLLAVLNQLDWAFVVIYGLLPFRRFGCGQDAMQEVTSKPSTGCHTLLCC